MQMSKSQPLPCRNLPRRKETENTNHPSIRESTVEALRVANKGQSNLDVRDAKRREIMFRIRESLEKGGSNGIFKSNLEESKYSPVNREEGISGCLVSVKTPRRNLCPLRWQLSSLAFYSKYRKPGYIPSLNFCCNCQSEIHLFWKNLCVSFILSVFFYIFNFFMLNLHIVTKTRIFCIRLFSNKLKWRSCKRSSFSHQIKLRVSNLEPY